jgi:CheY-like chemotaxis protein
MGARSALVIDDSKSARFAMKRYLENMSFTVDTAENAETALNYLKDHHPEIIFLDHVMPGVDGFDVLNSIKSDPRILDIPVVICSSNEGEAFTQEARFKGAAEVLSKPPTPQMLARVISALEKPAGAPAVPASSAPAVPAAPAAPSSVAAAMTAPAPAPATAHPAAPAHVQPSPADAASLAHLGALLEQMRAELASATKSLSDQIADLKTQLADSHHAAPASRGTFARSRHKILKGKPRLSGRRKLPRR